MSLITNIFLAKYEEDKADLNSQCVLVTEAERPLWAFHTTLLLTQTGASQCLRPPAWSHSWDSGSMVLPFWESEHASAAVWVRVLNHPLASNICIHRVTLRSPHCHFCHKNKAIPLVTGSPMAGRSNTLSLKGWLTVTLWNGIGLYWCYTAEGRS